MANVNLTVVKRLFFVRDGLLRVRKVLDSTTTRMTSFFGRSHRFMVERFAAHPYESWQMSIATFLLVVILGTQAFQVDWLSQVWAQGNTRPNLLAIVVEESIYSGEVKSSLIKYARNISRAQPDISPLIIPVERAQRVDEIAKTLERLYFEGDESGSRLASVFLVGDVPLPVVSSSQGVGVSVLPFVDYVDKYLVYNVEQGRYTQTEQVTSYKAEVGHGVLRPNTGNPDQDRQKIVSFFAKSHEYYAGLGRYADRSSEDPRVLIIDNTTDTMSLSPTQYALYTWRQKLREDLSYKRYTAEWSKALSDIVNGKRASNLVSTEAEKNIQKKALFDQITNNSEFRASFEATVGKRISTIQNLTDDDISKMLLSMSPSATNIPDIQSAAIIEKILPQWSDIFSSRSISDKESIAYNLGRYISEKNEKLNLDSIPKQGVVSDATANLIIKDTNEALKAALTPFFEDLAVDAPVLTTYEHAKQNNSWQTEYSNDWFTYDNYFAGKKAAELSSAQDCSIIRGTTQRVIASKGWDFLSSNAPGSDIEVLQSQPQGGTIDRCFSGDNIETSGFWGNHSSLSYNPNTTWLDAKGKVLSMTGFTRPVFDIEGAKKISSQQYLTKTLDPATCLTTDLIARPGYALEYTDEGRWGTGRRLERRINYPETTAGDRYTCQPNKTVTDQAAVDRLGFANFVRADLPFHGQSCTQWSASLADRGSQVLWSRQEGGTCREDDDDNNRGRDTTTYYRAEFRLLPSLIIHDAPNAPDYQAIQKNGATPNIPVDKDHKFAFLTPSLKTAEYLLPNFFRLDIQSTDTREDIGAKVRSHIAERQATLEALLITTRPDTLSAEDRQVYDTLKDQYPRVAPRIFDLVFADEKVYNSLISALYWTAQRDVDAQYATLLKNMLNGDTKHTPQSDIFLGGLFSAPQDMALIRSQSSSSGALSFAFAKADKELLPLSQEDEETIKKVGRVIGVAQRSGDIDIATRPVAVTSGPTEEICSPMGDAVELSEWPKALQCWLKNETTPKIIPSACSARTIGFSDPSSLHASSSNPRDTEVSQQERHVLSSVLPEVGIRGTYEIVATRLDKDDRIISTQSARRYTMTIAEIRDQSTDKVVYRSSDQNAQTLLRSYADGLDMTPFTLSRGEMTRAFTPKRANSIYVFELKDSDTNTSLSRYELRVRSSGIETTRLATSIRSDRDLDLSSLRYYGRDGQLSIDIVSIDIYDALTGDKLTSRPIEVDLTTTPSLSTPILKKTGSYTIVMLAPSKDAAILSLTVVPTEPKKLSLKASSPYFASTASFPVILRALDDAGNPALNAGVVVDIEGATLAGGAKRVEMVVSRNTTLSLTPQPNAREIKITASLKGSSVQATMRLLSARDFEARWVTAPILIAGGDVVTAARIEIMDASGARVSDFQGSATIKSDAISIEESGIKFNKGLSSPIQLSPRSVARRDGALKLEIPTLSLTKDLPLPIAPAKPMFVYLREAQGRAGEVEASLRDIYGNIVDQSAGETLVLTITHNQSGSLVPAFESSGTQTLTLTESSNAPASWSAPIKNITPGTRLLVRAETSRSLDTHSYQTIDESGAPEVLFGQKKSILSIARGGEIGAREFENLNPSFLYGLLTGDDFGSLEYSASESIVSAMLFDREARTLGISAYTSAGASSSVAQFLSTGKVALTRPDAALIETQLDGDGRPFLRIADRISRRPFVQAKLSSALDVRFDVCQGVADIGQCPFVSAPGRFSAYVPSSSALSLTASSGQDALTLSRDGSTIAKIYNNLRFELSPGLQAEILSQDLSASPFFQIAIKEGSRTLLTLTALSPMRPGVTSDALLQVERLESRYQITRGYVGSQTSAELGLDISDTSLTTAVMTPWIDEDLSTTWVKDIAGGLRIGEAHASKDTSLFLMYFGDPMLSLLPAERDATYDMTRGKKIYESNPDDPMIQALPFDLEGDGLDDVIIVTKKGALHLLKNTRGVLTDRGTFARLPQANVGTIRTIKNTQGVSHIVFINDTGRLALYGNIGGRITPIPIEKINPDASPTRYESGVQQLEVYDMDQDGREDIVALQSDGFISVLHLRADRIAFDQTLIDAGMRIAIQDGEDITGVAIAEKRLILPAMSEGDVISQRIRTILYGEVALPESDSRGVSSLDGGATLPQSSKVPFVRGDRAPSEDLIVQKTYTGPADLTGDDAQLSGSITVKNTLADIERVLRVLDRFPKVGTPKTASYEYRMVSSDGQTSAWQKRDFIRISHTDYDRLTQEFVIAPGSQLEIRYELSLKKIILKSLIVGNLDDDNLGEIAYHSSLQCGASSVVFDQSSSRVYAKRFDQGVVMASPEIGLREDIRKLVDVAKNNPNGLSSDPASLSTLRSLSQAHSAQSQKDEKRLYEHDRQSNTVTLKSNILSDETIEEISNEADDLIQQYACGYGLGGCINTPINWAPLAPGSVPRGFGMSFPILTEFNAPPVFSVPTTLPTPFGPVPFIWPGSPIGAGGSFGPGGPYQSFFRIYVTPTLTGSMGTALCFGPPVASARLNPLYPFVPAGNCIVTAKPVASCSKTGRSGNVASLGNHVRGNQANGFFNGQACEAQSSSESAETFKNAAIAGGYSIGVSSLSTPGDKKSLPSSLFDSMQTRGKTTTGPLLSVGGLPTTGESIEADFDPQALADFRFNEVIKIKNTRVSAFPDFIMDWVNRQMEEVQTKLTTLPTIYLILPDLTVFSDMNASDLGGDLLQSFNSGLQNREDPAPSSAPQGIYSTVSQKAKSFEDGIQSGVSGIEATYTFLGSLPFMSIEERSIPITYPVIHDREVEVTLEEWTQFVSNLKAVYDQTLKLVASAKGKEPGEVIKDISKKSAEVGYDKLTEEERFILDSGPFISSVEANLRAIEAYKKLPEQIQKYVGWREKYANEILCNVEQIGEIAGGFLRDNSLRFKKWVETYVLIKAIFKSWQVVIDLFDSFETECGSCINERYDLKYFIIKLLSFLIPEIPIIEFPKWPDIILDLHNVKLGITVVMPTLDINPQPLSLPRPPKVIWPDIGDIDLGSFTLRLPAVPQVIPAPPELPDLPDLEALPSIIMPKLPPPPKIPNLFALAGLADVLNILKLVSKMLCVLKNLPFVPEDKAGERIAQLTDRKGFHLLDFVSLDIPSIQVSSVDAIKITSYINYEYSFSEIADQVEDWLAPLNEIGIRATTSLNTQIEDIGIKDVNVGDELKISDDVKNLNEAIDKINQEVGEDVDLTPKLNDELNNLREKINLVKPLADETLARIDEIKKHSDELREERLDIDEVIAQNESYLPILSAIIQDPLIIARLETIMSDLKKDIASVRRDTSIEDSALSDHNQKYALFRSYIERVQEENALIREEIHTLHTSEDRSLLVQDDAHSLLTRVDAHKTLRLEAKESYERFARGIMTRETKKLLEALSPVTQAAPAPTSGGVDPFAEFVSAAGSPTSYPGLYYRVGDAQRLLTTDTDGLGREARVIALRLTDDASRKDVMYIHSDRLYLKTSKGTYDPGFDQSNVREQEIEDIMDGGVSSHATPDMLHTSIARGDESVISFVGDERSAAYMLELTNKKQAENTTDERSALALMTKRSDTMSIGVTPTLARVGALSRGQARVKITRMDRLTQGQTVTLTPGKSLYSDRSTQLLIRSLAGGSQARIIMQAGDSYRVDTDTDVRVMDGVLLLPTSEYDEGQKDLADLRGSPLLPGDRIDLLESGSRLEMELDIGSTSKQYLLTGADKRFDHLSLDVSESDMSATYDDPPLLSYGSLHDLGDDRVTSRGTILLSDARSSSLESIASLSYTREALLGESSEIGFPQDILIASPILSLRSVTGDARLIGAVSLDVGARKLRIAPIDALGEYRVRLSLELAGGLLAPIDLIYRVKAPNPYIQSITGSPPLIQGGVLPIKAGIPIDLIRHRNAGVVHISSGSSIQTTSTGVYSWAYPGERSSTLDVTRDATSLVKVDEYSGHITSLTGGITTQVVSSTSDIPSHLEVSHEGTPLMRLAIRRDASLSSRPITIVPPGGVVATGALAIEMAKKDTARYTGVSISPALSLGVSLTGGYIVHDTAGQLLFALSSTYEFALLDSRLTLTYDASVTDRIAVRMRDADGELLMTLFFPTTLYSRIY